MDIYENIRAACARRGTTITAALREIERASGCVGGWKAGAYPKLDIIMQLAEHLQMSIDEMVYGEESKARILTSEEMDWLEIIHRLPDAQKDSYKEILRVTAAPAKFLDKKNA